MVFDAKTKEILNELQRSINELLVRRTLVIQVFKNAAGLDDSYILKQDLTGFVKLAETPKNEDNVNNVNKEGG